MTFIFIYFISTLTGHPFFYIIIFLNLIIPKKHILLKIKMNNKIICSKCILDTTIEEIKFDSQEFLIMSYTPNDGK